MRDMIVGSIDYAKVMVEYGVSFLFNPMHSDEVQFRCPFHGEDNKPSARYYRATQTSYCWVCQKKWDVISFIMDKEVINYRQALLYLADRYKLDTNSIPDDPEINLEKPTISLERVKMISLENRIKDLKGKVGFEVYRNICEIFFMIKYNWIKDKPVLEHLKKLESKCHI